MGSLLDELKRRRRVPGSVRLGICSFAALQATEPLMHALGLPEWTLEAVVAALGLGFPVTVLLSWTFHLRSTGVERTARRACTSGPVPEWNPVPPMRLGFYAIGMGQLKRGQRALDDLIARFSHSMPFRIAEVSAWRGDPRYRAFLRRLNLPTE